MLLRYDGWVINLMSFLSFSLWAPGNEMMQLPAMFGAKWSLARVGAVVEETIDGRL